MMAKMDLYYIMYNYKYNKSSLLNGKLGTF